MWIVLFALRYKYTVAVLAILILLFGVLSANRMSTDILLRVESPEITLVWTYNGLDAAEMASKITSFSEIVTMNNVDGLVEVRSETSNSVLVTTFAGNLNARGTPAERAASEAAATRLRPVLMTATVMILGVISMAVGSGEGGEQNAPLGRAVIGGLVFGTFACLAGSGRAGEPTLPRSDDGAGGGIPRIRATRWAGLRFHPLARFCEWGKTR